MPNTEPQGLGPGLERRLKDALDRVTPPSSSPRYLSASAGARSWRRAPAFVAIGATCLLVLTAVAATGSPSPVVWTQRAASSIEAIGHHPDSSPSPDSEPTPSAKVPGAAQETPDSEHGGTSPTPSRETEPSPSSEPRESPEPSQSPEPRESPVPSVSPSPSGDQSESSPSPTSTSGDH